MNLFNNAKPMIKNKLKELLNELKKKHQIIMTKIENSADEYWVVETIEMEIRSTL